MTYVPILTTVGLGIYVIWTAMRPKIGLVNPDILKTEEKVVNSMDVEDIGDKIALCRCWRSKKVQWTLLFYWLIAISTFDSNLNRHKSNVFCSL